jgi:hypothetical protein
VYGPGPDGSHTTRPGAGGRRSAVYPLSIDAQLSRQLVEHELAFNAAVESGDFGPLVALFAPDAVMSFEGVPVGPFIGRDAIAAAYAAEPPTDTLTVRTRSLEPDGSVREGFSWSEDGEALSGEMLVRIAGGQIAALVVRFL